MLSEEEIKEIRRQLLAGVSPSAIATKHGIGLSTLRDRIGDSGYRIKLLRDLEPVVPVGRALAPEGPEPIPV